MMKRLIFILFSCLIYLNSMGQDKPKLIHAEFVYGNEELNQLASLLQTFPDEYGRFESPIMEINVPVQFIISNFGLIENVKVKGSVIVEYQFDSRKWSKTYYEKYFSGLAIYICKYSEGLWIPAEKDGTPCYDTIVYNMNFKWKKLKGYQLKSTQLNFFLDIWESALEESPESIFFHAIGSKPKKYDDSESLGVMYYNFALQKLNEKKYYIAERIFKLAYLKNPTNDCLFNLAISQLNLGWTNDACLNLNKLSLVGDVEASNLIKKYCTN